MDIIYHDCYRRSVRVVLNISRTGNSSFYMLESKFVRSPKLQASPVGTVCWMASFVRDRTFKSRCVGTSKMDNLNLHGPEIPQKPVRWNLVNLHALLSSVKFIRIASFPG